MEERMCRADPTRGCVVVGVSGSLRNRAVLRTASALAVEQNRRLVAVITWNPPGGQHVARRAPCPQLDGAVRDHARASLVDALEVLPPGIEVEGRVVRGQPGPVLAAIANQRAELLVVGAGRRGGLRRLIHGAVSRYCVARADCPVLTVPEPQLLRELHWVLRRRGGRGHGV